MPRSSGSRRRGARLVAGLALGLGATLVSVIGPGRPAGAAAPPTATSIAPRPHVYGGGGVIDFGDARSLDPGSPLPLNSVVVAMAVDPVAGSQGYWIATADGGVFAFGDAVFYGSLGSLALEGPVVGIAATPDGRGYWLVAMDGGVFAFGDAAFYGSMGGHTLNRPIVGMAAAPGGRGYWLVASDGGIFAFGDAVFHGSMGGTTLVSPVAGMSATADGGGYWLVAGDGGVFAFGDAPFYGSMGGQVLNDPVVGIAPSHNDAGYLLVATDGGIFGFGDVAFYGSLGGGLDGNPADVPPVAAIALTEDGLGYWLLEPDGWNYSFTGPDGGPPDPLAASIVSLADAQVESDPDPGSFCNPYGPCEEWCALFATWVWRQAGVPIPSFAFTGDIYGWAAADSSLIAPSGAPEPGDAVLYGTGPWSTATSLHVGIVAQRWLDGAIVTIEGDAGPAPVGSLAVVVNGPYLPQFSQDYNGMPIYAFATP